MFVLDSNHVSLMGGQNKAILVAVNTTGQADLVEEYLDELAFLAETAGIKTEYRFIQQLKHPDARTYVRSGKLQEIKNKLISEEIGNLIIDDDLSPSQLRNIEREINPTEYTEEAVVKVYDRSLLILDIFLNRAQTAQARTQVELARSQYLLPRLTRLWTHLERQRGGTGTRGGAGEKEIETDRRVIRSKISVLKEKLERIERQRVTQRKGRDQMTRVALVGYTNVGKSTLMNLLSGSGVLAENKLFATVDSTVRKVVLSNIPLLLSDTVGFIRKLPHHLIESFKSTLDEVREADILLHVVDAAHPFHDNHIEVVSNTLKEIGAGDIPTILVVNKIDLLDREELQVDEMRGYYREKGFDKVVFVSAHSKEGIGNLKELLAEEVKKIHLRIYPNYLQKSDAFNMGDELNN